MNCDEIAAALDELNEEYTDLYWDMGLHAGAWLLAYGGVVVGLAGEIPSGGLSTGVVVLSLGAWGLASAELVNDGRQWDNLTEDWNALCALWEEMDC